MIVWCVANRKKIDFSVCLKCKNCDDEGHCDYQIHEDQFNEERPDLIPMYSYHCDDCGIDFEDEQSELPHCLVCGSDFGKYIKGKHIKAKAHLIEEKDDETYQKVQNAFRTARDLH